MFDSETEGQLPKLLERGHASSAGRGDVSAAQLDHLFHNVDAADFSIIENRSDSISPVFALTSLVLALGFTHLAWSRLPQALVLLWSAAAVFTSLAPLLAGAFLRRRNKRDSSLTTRQVEFLAIIMAVAWAALPALFFGLVDSDMRIFGASIVFAVTGLGAFALARSPGAALAFVAITSGATSLSSLKIGGAVGTAFAISALLYGLALVAMVLINHLKTQTQSKANIEIQRQSDVIAFLLKDFEDGASDWLWETGPDFTFTYASPKLSRLLGVDAGNLKSLPLSVLAGTTASTNPDWSAFQNKLMARQVVAGFELNIPRPDGTTWLRLDARPLFDGKGVFLGYRGVGRDATGEKAALDQLVEAKNMAEQANSAKSHFLAVMSHELRTPLNAIVGFSELLLSPQVENLAERTRADHLRTILESSRHLQTLISDVLDATRIEKGTMKLAEQDADAAELLEVAVKMCRDTAERADCTVVARLAEGIEVRGDMTRIKQILINLVTNAVKFSAAGGFVHVGLERSGPGGLAFTVRDGGFGIGPEDLARVFEPFVQGDDGISRRYGGMGLGLSIARKLARLHGGDVTLESQVGVGTTARLILPPFRVSWPEPRTAATTAA